MDEQLVISNTTTILTLPLPCDVFVPKRVQNTGGHFQGSCGVYTVQPHKSERNQVNTVQHLGSNLIAMALQPNSDGLQPTGEGTDPLAALRPSSCASTPLSVCSIQTEDRLPSWDP